MNRKIYTLLITLILFGQMFIPANAQSSAHTLTDQLASYLKHYQGVVYAVIENDQKIVGGMGYADKKNHILAHPANTAFHIGSISKTFVAIAVLQQVEAGNLNLYQDIQEYLHDDGLEFQYPINLHQLLTHTAGFEDLISGIAVNDAHSVLTIKESLIRYQPAQFIEPSKVISYSNYGIALAAYIVEKAAGVPFDLYAKENIFIPLEMNHTTFDQFQDSIFVSKAYNSDLLTAKEPILNLYPEGSVITTANDMIKYMEWCLSDEPLLLSSASKELLFTSQYSGSEDFEGISYTFNIHNYNNELVIEKKGETAYFHSQLVLYPKQKAALFLSFNSPLPWSWIHSIQNIFTAEILGQKQEIEKPKIASIDPSGIYHATRSNFSTVERFLSLLIPDRTVSITKTGNNDFKLNGRPMELIGENLYDSVIGVVKVVKTSDKTILLTDSALSFIKVPKIFNPLWQWLAIISFICLIVYYFLNQIYMWLKGHHHPVTLISSISSLVLLCGFVVTLFGGLNEYNLLDIHQTLTWISISCIVFALLLIVSRVKRRHMISSALSILIVSSFTVVLVINNVIPAIK